MRRGLTIIAGWLTIILGAILFPLPVPLGAPLLMFGTLILARESTLVRRGIGRLRQRYPETSRRLSDWARRRQISSIRALERETDPNRIFGPSARESSCSSSGR